MARYDPDVAIEPEVWLEIDESARISIIVAYHEASDQEEPESGWELHATLHCLVENQLAEGLLVTRSTLAKLIRQGLGRHDAIHAIGSVASEELFNMMQEKGVFDQERYRQRLNKLTAKRWLKGKW